MRRGFTLVELVIGLGVMLLLVLGSMSLLVTGLRSLKRTDADVTITDQNARALRRVSERIRQAMTISVSADGKTVTYQLPKRSSAIDPVTGDLELITPLVSDGVTHSYTVNTNSGTLTDSDTGKVLVSNIYGLDPDPSSSLYNQAYRPFALNLVRRTQALTINLITRQVINGEPRAMKMKTSTILRNVQ